MKTKTVSVRIPIEIIDAIDERADASHADNRTDIIIRALEKYIADTQTLREFVEPDKPKILIARR